MTASASGKPHDPPLPLSPAALLANDEAAAWDEITGSRAGKTEVLDMADRAPATRGDPAMPPLWAAPLLCAHDLYLMERDTAGERRLTAVGFTQSTFFTVPDAQGKRLSEIHGPVPGVADRFGARVKPEKNAAFSGAWRHAAPAFLDYKKLDLYKPWVEAFLASN